MVAVVTDVGSVADHLRLSATDPERDQLEPVVAAINALVPTWIDPPGDDGFPANVTMGATMLAARVYRRRNSPAGVEAMGELGPVYVQRNDPDVAMLLGLGNFRPLRVG